MLCYWILGEKGKVLSHTTIQNLTSDKPRDTNIQEQICYYPRWKPHLEVRNVGTSLDGYESFINDDEESTTKGDNNME